MLFKSQLAKSVGQATHWALTRFTRSDGSSLPGKIALQLDPSILASLSEDYEIIVVTGTNGKTLTTALLAKALSDYFPHVITNSSGSNMIQGIVGSFLTAKSAPKGERKFAVLEIDEGSLNKIMAHLQPNLFLHTNLFADQLDRYGSVENVYQLLLKAAKTYPEAKVVANGDLPLFHTHDLSNPIIYYGSTIGEASQAIDNCPHCGQPLTYHSHTYANLGDYICEHCGFKRPDLAYVLDDLGSMTMNHAHFTLDGLPFDLPLGGLYNIYNALAAYSVARELGVPSSHIQESFRTFTKVSGRQEIIQIEDKSVQLHLYKNTVGLEETLKLLNQKQEAFTLMMVLNNTPADGEDISWIEDTNFDAMKDYNIQGDITIAGTQRQALKERLLDAEVTTESIELVPTYKELLSRIQQAPTKSIEILVNYSAMLEIRAAFKEAGYL